MCGSMIAHSSSVRSVGYPLTPGAGRVFMLRRLHDSLSRFPGTDRDGSGGAMKGRESRAHTPSRKCAEPPEVSPAMTPARKLGALVAELGADEVRVLVVLARRLLAGQRCLRASRRSPRRARLATGARGGTGGGPRVRGDSRGGRDARKG